MTTDDIDPIMLAGPRERVVIKTRANGWQIGWRYQALVAFYNTLGRLSITDTNEVYYSMLGSVQIYNAAELNVAHRAAQEEADTLYGVASYLARNQ